MKVLCPGFHTTTARSCTPTRHVGERRGPVCLGRCRPGTESPTPRETLQSWQTGAFGDLTLVVFGFQIALVRGTASSAGWAWLRRSVPSLQWPVSCLFGRSPLLTTPDQWILFQGHFLLLLQITFIQEQSKNVQTQLMCVGGHFKCKIRNPFLKNTERD